jgi:small subunit ribosomal protein S9
MFAEERDDLPQEPEGTSEEETPERLPDEEEGAPADAAPEAGEDAAPAGTQAAPEASAAGQEVSEGDAVGPEIEGAEGLAAAGEGEQGAEQPAGEGAPEGAPPEGAPASDAAPAPEGEAARERRPKRERSGEGDGEDEVIPGMHLEPDLVLEEQQRQESEFGQYAEEGYDEGEPSEEPAEEAPAEPEPLAATPLDLAADARYGATGKRKSAVARVILKPGEGTYSVNGRHLDEYFPRVRLQRTATQPLEATGNSSRMDVVARIHGGGVSAQATALRHGIARALVEADPALRTELKRRGYLTRDPRVKERKKAGLKKARKRPQFSKR